MTDLPAIIVAATGLLGAFGIGLRWLITSVTARISASEKESKDSRDKLEARFKDELDAVHKKLDNVEAQLAVSQSSNALYIRRIWQLEYLLHNSPGIDIPEMKDWPPK